MNHDDIFKANHTPDNTPPRTEIEARIVAWVLGEASPFESAELERLCAARPELAVFKNRISAVHGLVAMSAKPVASTLRLSADRRARLLAVLGGPPATEKTTDDLHAPSISASQPGPQSVSASVPQSVPSTARQPIAPRTPIPARKSNVVAFASTMRQWAMPIAACFVLLLLVSAVFVPKVYRSTRAPFALGTTREFSFVAGENQPPVVEAAPLLQNPFTPAASAPASAKNVPVSAARGSASFAFPTDDALKAGGKNGLFFDSPQVAQLAGTTGGSAQPVDARSESEIRSQKWSDSQVVSYGAQSTGLGVGAAVVGGFGMATGSISSASPAPDGLSTSSNGAVPADLFAPPSTSRRLDEVAAEVRHRRANEAAKDSSVPRPVSDSSLVTKGRSQYLAGDSDGAEETFRRLEANNPSSPEAKSFLGRIAKEKALVGELNRSKTRAQMVEEVSSAWQRPTAYADSPTPAEAPKSEWKPAILGKDRSRDDDSGITITAGTPQKFTIFELTDADKKEIDRRTAKKKAAKLAATETGAQLQQAKAEKTDAESFSTTNGRHPFFDEDRIAAQNEVIDEIKAAEAKAAQAAAAAVKADEPAAPTAATDPKIIESLRVELAAKDEAMSTFSLHVSDASYRLAKDALSKGMAPNPDTIRPEEFYNAFDYGDPAPVAGEPVAARIEQSAHPFMQQRNLVRIAMRVPAAGRGASQPLRLTVMLDTSGSMEREDRAATVRAALASLTSLLGPNDRVTLIGFARTPRLIAENVAGDSAATLLDAATKTPSEGGTNLEEALRLAETQALRQFTDGAQNRIVLLTDGAANLGDADPGSLAARIEKLRQRGVAFDACGIVAEGLNDNVLESLTRKGDGRYAIINSPEDADANFARQLAGAFRPAAKDVKVQVHFNPARVGRYRLIGFEQHRLKTEDFRNDAVDAAELASEEAATALYQIEVLPEGDGELGEVSVRFLDTNSNQRVERSWTIAYDAKPPAFARASASLQLAGSAAFLAEKLRGGELAAQFRLADFASVVNGLATAYPSSAPVREFITTFQQARRTTGD